MIRAELFQKNGKCMFLTHFCLLQVTQGAVYRAQIKVALRDIYKFRVTLFKINDKYTFRTLFCKLQVTQAVVY